MQRTIPKCSINRQQEPQVGSYLVLVKTQNIRKLVRFTQTCALGDSEMIFVFRDTKNISRIRRASLECIEWFVPEHHNQSRIIFSVLLKINLFCFCSMTSFFMFHLHYLVNLSLLQIFLLKSRTDHHVRLSSDMHNLIGG